MTRHKKEQIKLAQELIDEESLKTSRAFVCALANDVQIITAISGNIDALFTISACVAAYSMAIAEAQGVSREDTMAVFCNYLNNALEEVETNKKVN